MAMAHKIHTNKVLLVILLVTKCLSEITPCLLDRILYIEKELSLPVIELDDAVKVDSRVSESLLILAITGVDDRHEEFVFAGRGKGYVFACVG